MLSIDEIPDVFQDLTPIPQNDGDDRVCVIEYPSAFTLAYNYMRAVWAAKELSGMFVGLSRAWFFWIAFSVRIGWSLSLSLFAGLHSIRPSVPSQNF